MGKCFNNYSRYYDLLYKDKDYKAETDYIAGLIQKNSPEAKTILDVGCGTGKHAALLSQKGYQLTGLDLSETMLESAKKSYPQLSFYQGDARSFQLNKKFDVIVSLFHVASYQVTNEDLDNYLKSIRNHLGEEGLFIFDFWYGPGVLTDPPVVRVKRLEDESISVTRIAEPLIQVNGNYVDVRYEVVIQDKESKAVEKINELHQMRYFFLPEIQYHLQQNGFHVVDSLEWEKTSAPGTSTWNACLVARLKK